jgi:hypothetical protein
MTADAKAIVETFFTTNPKTTLVRLQWVDFSGILHSRFVLKKRLVQLANGIDRFAAANAEIIILISAPRCFPDGLQLLGWCPDW